MYNKRVLYTKEIVRARTRGDDNSISVLERRMWTDATLSIIVVLLRTTYEELGILLYWPRTTANKLPHNSENISERRGIMESYRLLQWYFHKIHNVTVDRIFHTWVARISLWGCWKGETIIRCLFMTIIASRASSTSYNKRLEWRTPITADPQEKKNLH